MSNLRLKDHTWDAANVYDSSLGITQEQINAEVGMSLAGKQGTLVSGENIKTLNGASILGSGNIEIQGGGGSGVVVDDTLSIAGAAADAKKTGDEISGVKSATDGEVVDIDPGALASGYVNTNTGKISSSSSGLGATAYIDIHDFTKIAYLRLRSTSETATTGMCFYDANKALCGGIVSLRSQPVAGYDTQLTVAEIPDGAYYARFTGYMDSGTYGELVVKGIKQSVPVNIENVSLSPAFGNIFTTEYTLPKIATYAQVIAAYDNLVERYPLIFSKNTLTVEGFTNYEYVFSTGNYNTAGDRSRDDQIVKPKVLIISGVHGDERAAVIGLYHLIKAMCENAYSLNTVINFCEYHIIPVVNPWGYDNNKRLNSNSVNINRNFASPNWEQTATGSNYSGAAPGDQLETKVVQNWIDNNTDAAIFIDCHNSGFLKEITCLLGLSDTTHMQAKINYLHSINETIPYLKKRRNIQDDNIFSYTGNTDISGTSKAYGEYKNIMTFTFETSFNVDQNGENGEFSNALTCEMTGAMLKGLVKYVLS